jgi:hypothetical protein
MVEMRLAWLVAHAGQYLGARGAARLAWRCWGRSLPGAPRAGSGRRVGGRSAKSGYHLAHLVGAGLSPVAIAVALYVLRSERAPETEREPAEGGGRRAYREA